MIEDILAVTLIFGGGTLFLLAVSPIGRALAERIRRPPVRASGAADELQAEILELRRDVADLAERVDFMERRLASPRP